MPAGDVTEGVVRVGGTIRRPHQPQSSRRRRLPRLAGRRRFRGLPAVPRPRPEGRDVLTFVPGECAGPCRNPGCSPRTSWPPWRRLAAAPAPASAGFVPGATPVPAPAGPAGPRTAAGAGCHLDVTPQNVVVRDGAGRRTGGFRPRRAQHRLQGFLQHRDALGAAPRPGRCRGPAGRTDPFRRLADLRRRLRLERGRTTAAARLRRRRRRLPTSGCSTMPGRWAAAGRGCGYEGVGGLSSRRPPGWRPTPGRLVRALTG